MPNKGIGFDRNVRLSWLDAAASICTTTDDPLTKRKQLDLVLSADMGGVDARRKTIDILINVWLKNRDAHPALYAEALRLWSMLASTDRLWLHYGLILLYYPFFRQTAAAVGQLTRYGETMTREAVKQRLAAERGQLGSLKRSAERVIASMCDWGVLVDGEARFTHIAKTPALATASLDVERWLLACALQAHPAEELPFNDLVRLPELFPFCFMATLAQLRADPRFAVQRQGGGWESVRLVAPEPSNATR